MNYWQTSCSSKTANTIYFSSDCASQTDNTQVSVSIWYPTTNPVPVPKSSGQGGTGGVCDCTNLYTTGLSGSIWSSGWYGNQEWYIHSSSNQDMSTYNTASAPQTFVNGGSASFSACVNKGFKNVAAKRQWHGVYGWTSNDYCNNSSSAYAPDQTKYGTYTISANYTNTTEISGAVNIATCACGGSVSINSSTGILSSTLNAVENNHSTPYEGTTYQSKYLNHGLGYTADGAGDITALTQSQASANPMIDCHCNGNSIPIPNGDNGVIGDNGGISFGDYMSTWNAKWEGLPNDGVNYSYTLFNLSTYNPLSNSQTVNGYAYFTGSDGVSIDHSTDNLTIGWSISNTTCTFNYSQFVQAATVYLPNHTNQSTISWTGTITLSDPILSSDVNNDCETLLGQWTLTDNTIYPWRTDNLTSVMPLVTRREVQTNISPIVYGAELTVNNMLSPCIDGAGNAPFSTDWTPTYDQMSWIDPRNYYYIFNQATSSMALSINSNHFDGKILGSPLKFNYSSSGSTLVGPGYLWFDFYARQVDNCQAGGDDCSNDWQMWDYFYGGTVNDLYLSVPGNPDGGSLATWLPQCSTHWTDNYEVLNLSRGSIRTSGIWNGAIYVTKWAEVIESLPSNNFFRPCGSDRVLIDEPSAQCLISGSSISNIIMTGKLNTLFSSAQQVLIAFSSGIDGIYNNCSQTSVGGAGSYKLTGTKISDLPTDYTHELSGYYGSLGNQGLVGVIRFPSAYGICGRTNVFISSSISASVSGSNIYTFLPQTNLRSNDIINLYDGNMNSLVTHSISRINDSNFFIPINATGSISTSQYAMINGAPDYHWNDNTPKFTMRYQRFYTSNRTGSYNNSSSCVQDCVNYSPCSEQVICFSPNGETFANGNKYWYGGSFTADDVFGAYEQLNCEGDIIDPYWQSPLTPCNSAGGVSISAVQDDGTCQADTTDLDGNITAYYAAPPCVEAFCNIPSGAPTMSVSLPAIYQPPLAGVLSVSFNTKQEIWQLIANEANNCAGCRFNYYICNGK